jgi:hypothetical protein
MQSNQFGQYRVGFFVFLSRMRSSVFLWGLDWGLFVIKPLEDTSKTFNLHTIWSLGAPANPSMFAYLGVDYVVTWRMDSATRRCTTVRS